MPYIAADERAQLDATIDALADLVREGRAPAERAGRLNYAVTRLVTAVLPVERYADAALATGVIENVKQELYRRAVAPYEDAKIAEHGDLPGYAG